ncbi:MAG: hypothetical protein KCHDKBKB_00471 [Elusimicrobia bacterium]|nr:hypothetical protein [Elusimicrobiota bacterium]
MSTSKTFFETIAWRVGLDVFSRGLFFLVNILIARTLAVGDFGLFVYAVSIAQIFYVFTDLGTLLQMSKEMGHHRHKSVTERSELLKNYFDLKMGLLFFSFITFSFCSVVLWKEEQPWVGFLALIWMMSNSMLDFHQFVCNGLGRIDLARKVMFYQRFFMLTGVVTSLVLKNSLTGILLGLSLGGVVGTWVSNHIFFSHVGAQYTWTPNFSQWVRILKASIPLAIGGAFGSWYLRLGAVFLAWTAGSSIVGEYGAAFRVFEITYIIPSAIMGIGLPHLTSLIGKGRDSFRNEVWRVGGLMAGMGVLWAVVLAGGAPWFIHILFGTRFEGGILPLKILGITGGLVFLNYFVTHLMVALNFQKRHAMNQILAFSVCALLSAVLIPDRGSLGAALSLLATEVFLFVITTAYLLNGTIRPHEQHENS